MRHGEFAGIFDFLGDGWEVDGSIFGGNELGKVSKYLYIYIHKKSYIISKLPGKWGFWAP